jgi:hypothetical protein
MSRRRHLQGDSGKLKLDEPGETTAGWFMETMKRDGSENDKLENE